MFNLNNTTSAWFPTLRFLNRKKTEFIDPISKKKMLAHWSFSKLHTSHLPIQYIQCDFEAFGMIESGFGDSFFFKEASIKGIAEAWERIWMRRLYKEKSDLPIFSSNGFASGRDVTHARERSLNELFERSIFLKAWHDQKGWFQHTLNSTFSRGLDHFLNQRGWVSRYFCIKEKTLGSVLCGFATNNECGLIFDAKFVGHHKPSFKIEQKLITSLSKMVQIHEQIKPNKNFNFPLDGDPLDQMRFYRNVENLKALDFLTHENISSDQLIELPCHDQTKSKIIFEGSKTLPAVCFSYNEKWPKLTWGKNSIVGKNPWPHPLA